MNSWQASKSEPSNGESHHLVYERRSTTLLVNSTTNGAGVWSAAVTVTTVPAEAKAAWCNVYGYHVTQVAIVCVEAAVGYTLDTASGNGWCEYAHIRNATAIGTGSMLRVPLSSALQFKWCAFTANTTVQIGNPVDYEM